MAKPRIDLDECTSQQRLLNRDIQAKEFKPFYFIWGAETYIRLQCLNNLTKALMEGSDSANKLVLSDDKIDLQEALNFAETPPFFGTRRVVVISGGGYFKKGNTAAKKYFDAPIEGAVLVFTDTTADTESPFFSVVNRLGRSVRCETPGPTALRKWAEQRLIHTGNKKISSATIEYFLQAMDTDMIHISSEMDKLLAYTLDKEEITTKDVATICAGADEANVFKLTDAIADQNRKAAVREYENLLQGKLEPGYIISQITRQLRGIMVAAELLRCHADNSTIAECIGLSAKANDYVISKYTGRARKINESRLIAMVEHCLRLDQEFKSGKISDLVALEMLITYCTL